MALSNYTELQASVADFLNRSDLTDVIPDFIRMTEAELNRVLRTREMSVRTRAPVSKQYLKLPVDFLGMRNIELMTDPVTVLEYRNLENLDAHRANDATGKPIFYSIMQNNIEFAPVPDSEYTLEIVYYQEIPPLAVNTTNWLLDSHPDIYLFGSLLQSAPYLQADERIGIWAGRYQQILEQLKTSDEKARFSGTTPTITFSPFG
tara:strand:- start:3829 stop:4443 length:615 start_codon:yes stop_codon:yes gene_type:complete